MKPFQMVSTGRGSFPGTAAERGLYKGPESFMPSASISSCSRRDRENSSICKDLTAMGVKSLYKGSR